MGVQKVGGTSGAESEKNGERIGESYLLFHGMSYFRDRVVRHPEVPPTFRRFLPLVAKSTGGAARRMLSLLQ